jgi:hypothetical protein
MELPVDGIDRLAVRVAQMRRERVAERERVGDLLPRNNEHDGLVHVEDERLHVPCDAARASQRVAAASSSGSEVSIRSLRLIAASASAIAPSRTPTMMATNASNSGRGPITYDTPATSKVSRMPSSATASSRSTARTVTLWRFLRAPSTPPISLNATRKVHDSSASENTRRPITSGVNGSTGSSWSSAATP